MPSWHAARYESMCSIAVLDRLGARAPVAAPTSRPGPAAAGRSKNSVATKKPLAATSMSARAMLTVIHRGDDRPPGTWGACRTPRCSAARLVAGAVAAVLALGSATAGALTGAGGDERAPAHRRGRAHGYAGMPPELPRGGRSIFPEHRVVAYYGAPQDEELGALGIRTPASAARRLERQAKAFARPARPVLPALELIAVIANRRRGPGRHVPHAPARRRDPAATCAPRAGQGVAPRRSTSSRARPDFFTEATRLEKWLREPDVGLALDPEWRVQAGRGAGRGHRPGRLARGQRRHGVAGPADQRRAPCRRSWW